MKKETLLKQLKKEKDPLKYLQTLLKKTQDKKLKKEIKDLIEKFSKKEKKPKKDSPRSLEAAVSHVSTSPPRVETETLEDYHLRPSRRIIIPAGIGELSFEGESQREDYSASIRDKYITTQSQFKHSLETKGIVSNSGFASTTESQEAIRREAGEERHYEDRETNLQNYSPRELHLDQEAIARTSDLRETHKKKKEIEVYHGQ